MGLWLKQKILPILIHYGIKWSGYCWNLIVTLCLSQQNYKYWLTFLNYSLGISCWGAGTRNIEAAEWFAWGSFFFAHIWNTPFFFLFFWFPIESGENTHTHTHLFSKSLVLFIIIFQYELEHEQLEMPGRAKKII